MYNLPCFKFSILVFNSICEKLINDYEEALSTDLKIIDLIKSLENTTGIKVDLDEINKQMMDEKPELEKEQFNKRNAGIIYSVIGSFVCELILKYLVAKDGGTFDRTHNLKTLYKALHSEELKEKIKNDTKSNCKFISDSDFTNQLGDSSENFKQLRYFFESPQHNINFIFLKGFRLALLKQMG